MLLHVFETGDFNDTVAAAITSHCYKISVKAIHTKYSRSLCRGNSWYFRPCNH